MNRTQYEFECERQRLISECHALVAAIASRPGSTKLLRVVVPMLEHYANYKLSRKQHSGR